MQRALIIDTSPLIRRVACAILSDFGYETSEAATGGEALPMLASAGPQFVLVDAGLTDMPALDVLRFVRDRLPKGTQVLYCPIEFCVLDLQRARAAGATDVLVKPFDRGMIAAKIEARTGVDTGLGRSIFSSRLARSELIRI